MSKVKFNFPRSRKLAFYLRYFYDKFIALWFEVKTPRLRMFVYEMVYSAMKFVKHSSMYPSPFNVSYVETVFGKFNIRPRTVDMCNVSPAFERLDVERTLKILGSFRDEGKRILFLDIGADLGTFAVAVGNAFKGYGGLDTMAFEPAPESFEFLQSNIEMNGLKANAELCRFALFNEDGLELDFNFDPSTASSSSLRMDGGGGDGNGLKVGTRTLDSVLKERASEYDVIFFKIDVEGVESEVLSGSAQTLGSVPEVVILAEDFINPAIVQYLNGIGASFIAKLTPYNSFWSIHNSSKSGNS